MDTDALIAGRTYDLLTQDATYSRLVSDFLKLRNLPGLSWMQDIVEDKMKDAADALLRQAQLETSLSEQKVC